MPKPKLPQNPVDTPLPDVLAFMQLLWAVVHGAETRSRRMSTEVGVTERQRLVLRIVGLFPESSAGDLAAILHVHPSTLTGLIQRLIAQRLLVRREAAQDRRRVTLTLTAAGARINAIHEGTVEAAIGAALRGVSHRQREATRKVLRRIAGQLDATPPIEMTTPIRRHAARSPGSGGGRPRRRM